MPGLIEESRSGRGGVWCLPLRCRERDRPKPGSRTWWFSPVQGSRGIEALRTAAVAVVYQCLFRAGIWPELGWVTQPGDSHRTSASACRTAGRSTPCTSRSASRVSLILFFVTTILATAAATDADTPVAVVPIMRASAYGSTAICLSLILVERHGSALARPDMKTSGGTKVRPTGHRRDLDEGRQSQLPCLSSELSCGNPIVAASRRLLGSGQRPEVEVNQGGSPRQRVRSAYQDRNRPLGHAVSPLDLIRATTYLRMDSSGDSARMIAGRSFGGTPLRA